MMHSVIIGLFSLEAYCSGFVGPRSLKLYLNLARLPTSMRGTARDRAAVVEQARE